jgi:hypothetical protein
MLRGLRALEAEGLVRFAKSGRGHCPAVEIVQASPPPSEALPANQADDNEA